MGPEGQHIHLDSKAGETYSVHGWFGSITGIPYDAGLDLDVNSGRVRLYFDAEQRRRRQGRDRIVTALLQRLGLRTAPRPNRARRRGR